jgi:hypothetical protein
MLVAMRAYLEGQDVSMRRVAFYIGLTAIVGALILDAGERWGWSHGALLAVTTVICGPLSLAALWDNPLDRLWRSIAGRRTSRRPAP